MCFLPALPAAGAAAGGGLTLGTALQAGALALSLGGSLLGGMQQSGIADANAALAAQQRDAARDAAAAEELRLRERFRRDIARQRAELVSNGVALDSPTALLLGDDAIAAQEFDALQVRQGGEQQAAALDAETRLYQSRARRARLTGVAGAATTLLQAPPTLWRAFGGNGRVAA